MRGAVLVCGLNGAGKSTLGRALAERLGVPFLDSEDLFFPKNDPEKPRDRPRTPREARKLLLRELSRSPDLVFAAVRCDFGPEVLARFRWAVLVEVPRQLRLERVRERSYRRFGERMRPGGDLHQGEEAFFRMVEERPETLVEEWLRAANLPVLRVDGTRPPAENAAWLAGQMGR